MKRSIGNRCIILSLGIFLLLNSGIALAEEQGMPATAGEQTASPSPPAVPAETAAPASSEPAAAPPVPAAPSIAVPDQGKNPDQAPPTVQLSPPITRIGVVDMVRIDRESKQGKAAQAKVKAKKEKLQAQLTAKQKQLEKQKAEIESQLPTLSPAQRAKKAKEFEKKVDEYRKLLQKAENDMKPLVEELARNLTRDIKDAASAYGKANGLAAVISNKELMYVGPSAFPEDVTDGVLRQLEGSGTKK